MHALVFTDGLWPKSGLSQQDQLLQHPLALLPAAAECVLNKLIDGLFDCGVWDVVLVVGENPEAYGELLALHGSARLQVAYRREGTGVYELARGRFGPKEPVLVMDPWAVFDTGDVLDLCRECEATGRSGALRSVAGSHVICLVRPTARAALKDLSVIMQRQPVDEVRCAQELHRRVMDHTDGVRVADGASVPPSVLNAARGPIRIREGARIEAGVELIGPVDIGVGATVASGARVQNAMVCAHTAVGEHVDVCDAIVSGSVLWRRADSFATRVEDASLLGPVRRSDRVESVARMIERSVEVMLCGVAIIALAPLFSLVSAGICLADRGPALYVGRRVTRLGHRRYDERGYSVASEAVLPFPVFRTMGVSADENLTQLNRKNIYATGPYRKCEDDVRVTRLGWWLRKTSIDELPLLWSVLVGRLHLVGLWALPTYEARDLGRQESLGRGMREVGRVRFSGRPGLAGLWQSRGRSSLTAEERLVHDSYQAVVLDPKNRKYLTGEYAQYGTLRGRLRLLVQTVLSVVHHHGI